MIELLVTLGILWIVLRVLAAFVALPFRLLGVLLNTPMGTIFWIFLVALIILSMRRNNDVEGNGAYRMKDLFRSTTNRRLFGVCGGIAEYFGGRCNHCAPDLCRSDNFWKRHNDFGVSDCCADHTDGTILLKYTAAVR